MISVIFLDFRKAFDVIDQNILFENMRAIGIRQSLTKWFATYLKNRSHFTKVDKEESEYQYVNGKSHRGVNLDQLRLLFRQINYPW